MSKAFFQQVFSAFIILALVACSKQSDDAHADQNHHEYNVATQLAKFTPVEIAYDASTLSEGDQKALIKIVEASRLMNDIFLHQVYSENVALQEKIAGMDGPEMKAVQEYFTINFGPFDRLEHNKPFLDGVSAKPAGANYYPADMSKAEFNKWVADNPTDEPAFTGYFSVIRRDGDRLVAIPYSEAYKTFLTPAAKLLKEAAELTDNSSLATYLNSRADAFFSDDYYQSDMDWMDLKDHSIEVVIGPYEVYEDELFNYKAAFESFVTLVDPEDSQKLSKIGGYLNTLEQRLPIPEVHKNLNRGSESPLKVVNVVYTAGDAVAGVQTIAFNLPNDERVREAKGSKKVMLKNISQAKYEKISTPIMKRVLAEKDLSKVSFDAFFYHVLMHEMVHGIGPGKIVKDGRETTVNKELKELYSVLEEAKADVVGLYFFPYMVNEGVFDEKLGNEVFASFVGGIFRSVRFGINEAHGGANVISLNYLLEKGGILFDAASERFSVNDEEITKAVATLANELLMLQANGDYDAAVKFVNRYRVVSPELATVLAKLSDIPVDIKPIYGIEKMLSEK